MDRSSDPRRAPGAGAPDPAPSGPARGVLGGDDVLGDALARWASEAAVDEAARARARDRWLRIQAEEEASFVGTLVDLAERARPVVLDIADQRVRGVVAGVGGDFVAVHTDRGQRVLVRTEAIDAVRAEPGGVAVVGDRSPTLDVTLDAVLGPVAADRPDVLIRTRSGTAVRGELRRAGSDVVQLRVAGDPPTPVWVAVDAVAMLVLEP